MKVQLKREPGNAGYLWESLLAETKPSADLVGDVVGIFKLASGDIVFDVEWSNGHVSKNIFPGEVKKWIS